MAFPIIPILTALAPTLGAALIGDSKSKMFEKAMDVLTTFLGREGPLSADELSMELAKLDVERQLTLARLDTDFKVEMARLYKEVGKINAQTNLSDSKSERFFQYGWRPALAWSMGLGLIYGLVITPLLSSLLAFSMLAGIAPDIIANVQSALPVFNLEAIMGMVSYLLGYGAYRTYEKTNKP